MKRAPGKGASAGKAAVKLAAKPQGALGGKLKKEQHKGAHDALVKKEHAAEVLGESSAPEKAGAKAERTAASARDVGAKVVAVEAQGAKTSAVAAKKSAAVPAKGVAVKQVAVKLVAQPKGALGGKLKKEQHTGTHDVLVKKEGANERTRESSKPKGSKP